MSGRDRHLEARCTMTIRSRGPLHVLILASHGPSLVNFRGPLISAMIKRGWRVTAAAADIDVETRQMLVRLGARPLDTAGSRKGMNPFVDLAYWWSLQKMMKSELPDVVISYTIKPVIWGSLAAKWARIPRVVAMITGLGYAFTRPERPNIKYTVSNVAARVLYRLVLPSVNFVLFQNPDDRDLFRDYAFTPSPGRTGVTAGSGVDLERYAVISRPHRPSFLMLSRLLGAKGVREYAAAAIKLKARWPDARFRLAGYIDVGPDAIRQDELDGWTASGVEFLGLLNDVRPAIAEAGVYVLPSYYREGTPRSILEALAMGRPIITTNMPGCKETVVEGVNGFLVPPRNIEALAEAMERFILDLRLMATMGDASLVLAKEKYDVRKVNQQVLAAIAGDD